MANKLLYPRSTTTRRIIDMDGMWKFRFDYDQQGDKENWKEGLRDTTLLPVPASFNDFFTDKDSREYAGDVWYETQVMIPDEWAGMDMDLDLRFGCVTHTATVYVNGVEITRHKGGFLPFNANINQEVCYGKFNRVVVKVNNELSMDTLPVGRTITLLNGKKMVKPFFDFFNYAGLNRPMKLVATPKESIVDFTVKHNIREYESYYAAAVEYTVETTGNHEVYLTVYDEEGIMAAASTGKKGIIRIEKANLWNVRDAYLYTFMIKIMDGDRLIDEYSEEIGIRTVEVRGTSLLINGRPVYLKGCAKHEDSEYVGRGYAPGVIKRDFELMKWIGANSFRTSHYPYSEEIYQMADREGFIIIDETPAVGMVFYNQASLAPGIKLRYFDNENVHGEQKAHHLQVIRDMVARDKNHASVCIWSLLNEPDNTTESAERYFKDLFTLVHELDPQKRPRTYANVALAGLDSHKCSNLCDILAINRYYGWYLQSGYEITDAEESFRKEMDTWAKEKKPLIITEYGADTYPGLHKLPSVQWSEEYQQEFLETQHKVFDSYDFVIGEHVWNFADFMTTEELRRVDGNKKGIFTRDRQPKMAAFYMKKRWESMPLDYKNNADMQ